MAKSKKMTTLKPPILSKQAVTIMGLLLLVGAIVFFAPYLGVISISALMAYTFLPLYKIFRKKMPDAVASWSVLLVGILAVIIPLGYIAIVFLEQGAQAVTAISNIAKTEGTYLHEAIVYVSDFVGGLGTSEEQASDATQESLINFMSVIVPSAISFLLGAILNLIESIPVIVVSVTIFAFLFCTVLRKHEEIGRFLYNISPLDESITGIYLQRSSQIVIASLRGQIIISFASAVLSSLLLSLIGFGPYFWFMVVLFTILNMIPLGSGLVVIPLCIIYMFSVDLWSGFWVLMIYLLVICNFETVIRPKVIPKNIDLIPALTILSVFCGIYYFGLMGVVYGPLIVILLTTTASLLADQKKLKLEKEV